jgi:hypothetical protein
MSFSQEVLYRRLATVNYHLFEAQYPLQALKWAISDVEERLGYADPSLFGQLELFRESVRSLGAYRSLILRQLNSQPLPILVIDEQTF